MDENSREFLLAKRMDGLLGVWETLSRRLPQFYTGCILHPVLLRETVENYLNDREIYKLRHRIEPASRIMLHKVAGMIAASICKFRPIQLGVDPATWPNDTFQNERFAVWTGIAVCSEPYLPNKEALDAMLKCEHFYEWEKDMLSLFQRRPDSADAFVVIYRTLCMKYLITTVESSKALE